MHPGEEGCRVESRVSIVTLGVRDLGRSVDFYRDGLGWPKSSVGDEMAWNPSFPMAPDGGIELPD
jgi:catechol 2,3-dioxygenase-like lactoylglutathione lyase family enzyme